MKITAKYALGLAAASCLALAGSAIAKPGAGGSHGNSAFGLNQRTELHTGADNSAFGRNTAANARLKSNDSDDEDEDLARTEVKTKKVKKQKSTYPGNSAFGRSQRVNHLKGSGNSIYGKTTSANAKAKAKKNRD